jgi:hypothetical protein
LLFRNKTFNGAFIATIVTACYSRCWGGSCGGGTCCIAVIVVANLAPVAVNR